MSRYLIEYLRGNQAIRLGLSMLLSLSVWQYGSNEANAQDPFAEGVRTTEPLSPTEQLKSFEMPADLAVDLIAAEPEIQKPLNIAFDVRGRLWVTCTIEYPYPAKEGQGRDRIVILEDTNRDGHFDKQTVFADNLNIPIGILPLGDDCIVFDIPYIWRMSDTNGDGVCDHKQQVLGPFDCTRDTHGMNNSFIHGFDGWIYACHGFSNRSVVAGADGHTVTMNSGNVYRFLPDGSRIEHFSHGQVNPFGMACDDWFSLFTADCHSKPLTQVLRGAYYPSFGAPHDGLGFAPSMMEHFHGSTAIAGVEVISDLNFPSIYEGQIVSGNVMTSRVNRNRLQWNGAYAQAIELPDLLATTDPWFRPVNLIQGPDGGLYIADFYNRIIGHYEVPLEHPGRDRDSGRIWRLRSAETSPADMATSAVRVQSTTSLEGLWPLLNHPVTRTRLAVLNEIVARVEDGTLERTAVTELCRRSLSDGSPEALQVASLWCLLRVAPDAMELKALHSWQAHATPVVRGHIQRVLAEALPQGAFDSLAPANGSTQEGKLPFGRGPELNLSQTDFSRLIANGLQDEHPRVVQLAVDAAGRIADPSHMPTLLTLATESDQRDPVLVHTARIALKRVLGGSGVKAEDRAWVAGPQRQAETWQWIKQDDVARRHSTTLAGVMLAIPNEAAADYLLDYLSSQSATNEQSAQMIQHIAKHLPATRTAELVGLIQSIHSKDISRQWELLMSVGEGLSRSGQPTPPPVLQWADFLVKKALEEIAAQPEVWQAFRLDGQNTPTPNEEAWQVQVRPILADATAADTTDGAMINVPMFSSLPAGESRTGIIRSPEFKLPESLQFAIAGHRGFPDQPPHDLNEVRLRLEDGEVIQTAYPPRHDVARWVQWDLRPWAGRLATLEIQDGDTAGAYAWLAVGQFDPSVVVVPAWSPSQLSSYVQALCRIASRFRLTDSVGDLQKLLLLKGLASDDRLLVAQTIADLRGEGFGRAFAGALIQDDLHSEIKKNIAELIGVWPPGILNDPPEDSKLTISNSTTYLRDWIPQLNGRQQKLLVRAAINEAEVFQRVLDWAETGHLSADSFTDATIQQQIKLADAGDWMPRIEKLLADLPPTDEAWRKRVTESNERFKPWLDQLRNSGTLNEAELPRDSELAQETLKTGSMAEWKQLGQLVFKRDCAACHQLGGQGTVVGPQLDGIHRRGLERVLEDILLPNQNVDHSFRSQLLLLDNGQVLVGLVQAEDAASVQMTDQQGKSLTIPVDQIDERQITQQSLMPTDIAHPYTNTTLFALMVYLQEQ